jgi:hypothetical protein
VGYAYVLAEVEVEEPGSALCELPHAVRVSMAASARSAVVSSSFITPLTSLLRSTRSTNCTNCTNSTNPEGAVLPFLLPPRYGVVQPRNACCYALGINPGACLAAVKLLCFCEVPRRFFIKSEALVRDTPLVVGQGVLQLR